MKGVQGHLEGLVSHLMPHKRIVLRIVRRLYDPYLTTLSTLPSASRLPLTRFRTWIKGWYLALVRRLRFLVFDFLDPWHGSIVAGLERVCKSRTDVQHRMI